MHRQGSKLFGILVAMKLKGATVDTIIKVGLWNSAVFDTAPSTKSGVEVPTTRKVIATNSRQMVGSCKRLREGAKH